MSSLDRPADFYWEGQARWQCPDCPYDGISARDVERHRVIHRHEQIFREMVEAGQTPNMEDVVRRSEKQQHAKEPPVPPLFDYANRPLKP